MAQAKHRLGGKTEGTMVPLLGAYLVFVALHVAASFLLPDRLWGAHHLRFVGTVERALWFVLAALLLVPTVRRRFAASVEIAGAFSWKRKSWKSGAVLVLGLALLVLFRSRNPFLGDGKLLAGILSQGADYEAGHAGDGTFFAAKLLSRLLEAAGWEAAGAASLAFLSLLSGLLFLIVAVRIAEELFASPLDRGLLLSGLIFSGAVFLFFGYVELYAPMHALIALYLLLGLRLLRGKGGILPPSAALAGAVAAHLSAAVLLPSWLFLVLGSRRLSVRARIVSLVSFGAAILFLVSYAAAARKTYAEASPWVPLLSEPDATYALFAPAHLALYANAVLAGLGGTLLAVLLRRRREGRSVAGESRAIGRFLAAASLPPLLFAFATDPKLGSRDIDLLSLPILPLSLFLVHSSRRSGSPPSRSGVAIVAGAMLLHTAPWILANAREDRAVRMTLAMVARDPHYDNPNLRAARSLALLLNAAGYSRESALVARRAADAIGEVTDFCNVGKAYGAAGDYDEAILWFKRGIDADPRSADAYDNLAIAYRKKGDLASAEAAARSWIAARPEDGAAWRMLGNLLGEQGRLEETLEVFERCVRADPDDAESWGRLAVLYRKIGRPEDARAAADRADRARSTRGGG